MRCPYLDPGSVPNRDSFARFWRDVITYYADLLPKANGLANDEEGEYSPFPYQANYIKGLKRLDANLGDDPDPDAYCDYLRILREARLRVSNDFNEIRLQGGGPPPAGLDCPDDGRPPRKQTNPQGGLPVSITGPDPSGVNLNLFRNQPRSLRPAPRGDGRAPAGGVTREHENTAEMVELYWMALLRDLPFRRWALAAPDNRLPDPPAEPGRDWRQLEANGATIEAAVRDLNRVRQYFAEPYPVRGDEVTAANIFRGAARGDEAGPYISQFLLRGNTVPCARNNGLRQHPRDGVIMEGAVPNLQRQVTVEPYVDFLRQKREWRCVEQGFDDPSGSDALECGQSRPDAPVTQPVRFIRDLRDLGNWVHLDDPAQHFRNAALLMLSEPPLAPPEPPDAKGAAGVRASSGRAPLDSIQFESAEAADDRCRPQGRPFPFAPCNPYVPGANPSTGRPNDDADTQAGFVTFGPEHVLDALGEVTDLALRAAWWQKWYVHRRLRPEEFGGLVDGRLRENPARPYSVDSLLLNDFPDLLGFVRMRNGFTDVAGQSGGEVPGEPGGSYLLPQLYPEGSPTHPSYPSGHATIAGACATLLKVFFDVDRPMTCHLATEEPDPTRLPPAFVASDDGLRLLKAAENDKPLTVEGELNKLASNISIGRNAAGVHWRSDATQGMELGEAVTAYFLYEQAWALNEEAFCFSFRRFFRPERVTITRQTEYRRGQELRRVAWSIQRLAPDGKSLGEPETLTRTRTIELPG